MKVFLAIVALVVAASFFIQSDPTLQDSVSKVVNRQPAPTKPVSIADKISPHAVYPVNAESYPQLAKTIGAKGIEQLNDMMQPAAQKVARSPKCDRVEVVGVSDRTTSADALTLYVDCANLERYYITQADLTLPEQSLVTQSEKAKSISDVDAIRLCESEIKPDLSRPDTFDRGIMFTSVQRHKTTGNLTVRFPFEASNRLDMALSYDAKCVVSGPFTADVVITES